MCSSVDPRINPNINPMSLIETSTLERLADVYRDVGGNYDTALEYYKILEDRGHDSVLKKIVDILRHQKKDLEEAAKYEAKIRSLKVS